MPFPFSFMFSAPGITNPFTPVISSHSSAPARPPIPITPRSPVKPTVTRSYASPQPNFNLSKHQEAFRFHRPPSPRLVPPYITGVAAATQPLCRKRGWVPSSVEPSIATTIPTSMSGYLDTPSKYRDMAPQDIHQEEDEDFDDMVADLPPPKRRRTLAGSIVSTALSAALIGTAVGVTMYRLWANRGKPEQLPPPPPYEQGEWVPPTSDSVSSTPVTHVAAPTSKRKQQRHVAGRRTAPRPRKSYNRLAVSSSTSTAPLAPVDITPARSPLASEFRHASPPDPADVSGEIEEQMDWLGDKLSQLIEEGKRALGKEVVVASEVQEDEVDDGSGEWVEEDSFQSSRASTSGSIRRSKCPRNINITSPPPSYTSPYTTPRRNHFDLGPSRRNSFTSLPRTSGRGTSADSDSTSLFRSNHKEDESEWQTPELRESMERARQTYLQRSCAS